MASERAAEDEAACSSPPAPTVQALDLRTPELSGSLPQPPVSRPATPPKPVIAPMRSTLGLAAAETLPQPFPARPCPAGSPPSSADGLIGQTSGGEVAAVTEYILRVERTVLRTLTFESRPPTLDVLSCERVRTPEGDPIQEVSERQSLSPQPSTVPALAEDDSGSSVVTGAVKCVGASLLDGDPGSEERQFASTSAGSEERLTASSSAWRSDVSESCDDGQPPWSKLPTLQPSELCQQRRSSLEPQPMTARHVSEHRRRVSAPSVDAKALMEASSEPAATFERPSLWERVRKRSVDLQPMTAEAVFEARRRQSAPSLDPDSDAARSFDTEGSLCTDEGLVQRASMRLTPVRPSPKAPVRRHSLVGRITAPLSAVGPWPASSGAGATLDRQNSGAESQSPASPQSPLASGRRLAPLRTSRLRS